MGSKVMRSNAIVRAHCDYITRLALLSKGASLVAVLTGKSPTERSSLSGWIKQNLEWRGGDDFTVPNYSSRLS